MRKLPWGFVYSAKGIPAVHIAYWPKPFTRYTEAITSREWSVLEGGKQPTGPRSTRRALCPTIPAWLTF